MAPDDCRGIGARLRDLEVVGGVAFVMSKSGATPVSTYLRIHEVPTSQTGQILLGSPLLTGFVVSTTQVVAHDTRVQLQRRTGQATFADIPNAYVDILAGNYKGQRTGLGIQIGPDDEISAYVSSGDTLSNPVLTGYTAVT